MVLVKNVSLLLWKIVSCELMCMYVTGERLNLVFLEKNSLYPLYSHPHFFNSTVVDFVDLLKVSAEILIPTKSIIKTTAPR